MSKFTKIYDYSGRLYAVSDLSRPNGQELLAIRKKDGSWDRRYKSVKKAVKQTTEKKHLKGILSVFAFK